MKRTISTLLLVLLCLTPISVRYWIQETYGAECEDSCSDPVQLARMSPSILGASSGVAAAVYCTGANTCTATNPGECDVLCEDFEGATDCDGAGDGTDSNCRNALAVTIAAGDSVDFTTAHTGTFSCADKGSNSFQITNTANSHKTSACFTAAANKDDGSVQVYTSLIANGFSLNCFGDFISVRDSSPSPSLGVRFKRIADNKIVLSLYYWNSSAAGVTVDGTTSLGLYNATPLAWIRVNLVWDKSAGTAQVFLNGVSEIGPVVDVHTTQRIPRQFCIGNPDINNVGTYTYQVDNWAVDDDTIQGTCN